MEVTFVIIDDNPKIAEHAFLFSLEDKYSSIRFFTKPNEGLDFIIQNLDKNLIVILDIQFSENDREDGHSLLRQIHESSSIIPVILWSGINETNEEFSDFINNDAFGFLSKMASLEECMDMADKAYMTLENSLANTIEDWIIQSDKDKDTPIYVSTEGRSFSLNDLLKEIRNGSKIGKEFEKKLNSLTIDLLLRKKENL
tara:strand:+ start:1808 stop:2404 length:597 start_codon:yes stop_codon:yes gene_type:complete